MLQFNRTAMDDLPLFPLNTVLFPNMPLPLHIFEERYKRMIAACVQEKHPFGVALIRSGREANGPPAEPHAVGCSAEVMKSQALNAGRLNIVAAGVERFRIHSLSLSRFGYLVGRVEPFPWEASDPDRVSDAAEKLRRRFVAFAERLGAAEGGFRVDPERLPEDPLTLACVAASLLPVDPIERQRLLELADTADFVEQVLTVYRRESALLRKLSENPDRTQSHAYFSDN